MKDRGKKTHAVLSLRPVVLKAGLILLLAGSLLWAQPSGRSAPAHAERMADSLWIQDLDFLAQELAERHKNLFFRIPPKEFSKLVEDLKRQIPGLDDYEIVVSMMGVVASIGDSHTLLGTNVTGLFHKLPVLTEWYSDGLHVVRTAPEYRAMLGRRVLGIEGKAIEEVSKMVGTVIPHDNDAQLKTRGPHHMAVPEILAALGIVDGPDTVTFNLETLGPVEVIPRPFNSDVNWVSVLDSIPCGLPLYLQNRDLYYWFTYLQDSGLLYVQYNACRDIKTKPFASFTEELADFIDSHPVDKFVFDIRANTGGNSAIARPMIDAIKQRPSINRKGHLFVLLGRKTFSSAILNALQFKDETNAVCVGEPTGGKPNHYGEVRFFMLPNSRLTIQYSTKYFSHSSEDEPSLLPDIDVDTSFSDFISCKDPVLQTVIAYDETVD